MKSLTLKGPGLILAALSLGISSFLTCIPAAHAQVEYNGVQKSGVNNGLVLPVTTSIFVQPDPAFSGDTLTPPALAAFGPLQGNIPSYSVIGNQNFGFSGVNIPRLGTGNFPSTGNFQSLQYFYSLPGNGNADDGLTFVVQTGDGLLHSSNFATTGSQNVGSNNGRRQRRILITNINAFSPPLAATGQGSRIRRAAVVFAGTAQESSINLVFPPHWDPNLSTFTFLQGSAGQLFDDPRNPTSLATFAARVSPPDSKFNFE